VSYLPKNGMAIMGNRFSGLVLIGFAFYALSGVNPRALP
jgi:hypothetical protein